MLPVVKRISLSLLGFALAVLPIAGQNSQSLAQESKYKFDLGAGAGMSGYLGDANESNVFKHPGVAFNATFRYLINTRLAVRGVFGVAQISGDTSEWENVLPAGENYKFKSTVYDLGGRFEFNFFPYGIGETYKKLKRWTPYLSLGVGCTMASRGDDGAFFAPNIPMGIGVKYKIHPRINLGVEFTMTKVFGDKIDSDELTDLYEIKSSFLKNTDWYSSIQLSITYEFGERCVTCHYVD